MFDEQEKQAIVEFARESLREKRAARRWGIFFKIVFAAIFLLLLQTVGTPPDIYSSKATSHTALVKLEGPIVPGARATADNINQALADAFENDAAEAVILELNTPGGSPVQAARINDQIQHLRTRYPDKPLYAVISDVCASGGVFVAVAADAIYANPASLVGSIGVIVMGFGMEELIENLGIERRLFVSGEHKAMLDPFLPQKPEEIRHVQTMLDQIHEQFVERVKRGRGSRLADDPDLFSGLIWTGEEAKELGLVDGFGDVKYIAREIVKQESIVEYDVAQDFLDKFVSKVSTAVALWLVQWSWQPILK